MTDELNDEVPRDRATRIFLRNYSHVRSIAFQSAPQRALVDDIVNDAFVDFVKKADHWDYSGNMPALLSRIVKNIAHQYWRQHLRSLPESIQKVYEWMRQDLANNSNDNLLGDEELSKLRQCLDKLSAEHRDIIQRHYYDGIPFTELARTNRKNVKALQKMASRIRAALRQCMEKNGASRSSWENHHE